MPSPVSLRCAGGAIVGIDAESPILASLLEHLDFVDAAVTDAAPTVTYRQSRGRNGGTVYRRYDSQRGEPGELIGVRLEHLVDDLHLTVALHATDDVFVHAGAVAWNNSAIVLPGRSHAGKSTLVHALVAAGAAYLSDEYARITADGSIAPYSRPLQLRTDAGRRLVDARSIGAVAVEPVPPGLVVMTTYAADAGAFDEELLSPGRAALELLDNIVIADVHPARAAAAAAAVARMATTVRSTRGDAAGAATAILALADELDVAA